MPFATISCARFALGNHPSNRFCSSCGLPLGTAQAEAEAANDALGEYEAPEPADQDVNRLIRDLVARAGFDAAPARQGWRLIVPLELDRRQAVYIGHAG